MFIKPAYAQCPICVVTVGGGLLIAKKLGIDDLLVSIWLSGLNTAIAFWIASKFKTKLWNNGLIWSISFYFLAVLYLFFTKQIGHPSNTFIGIDKILFGMTIGFFVSLVAIMLDKAIRLKNKGKVVIYYQKVIIPTLFLTVTTLIFKLLL